MVEFDYDPVINMFANNEVAIVTGTSRWANDFRNQGMDDMFLPYFGQNGEQWLLTTPGGRLRSTITLRITKPDRKRQ